jgi:hypothetical protein
MKRLSYCFFFFFFCLRENSWKTIFESNPVERCETTRQGNQETERRRKNNILLKNQNVKLFKGKTLNFRQPNFCFQV